MQRARTRFFFFLIITFIFFFFRFFYIILLSSILFCMHFTLKVCLVKRIKGGCLYALPSPRLPPPPSLLYSEEELETAVHVLRRNEHETYRIQTREFSEPISGDKSPCHLHTTLDRGEGGGEGNASAHIPSSPSPLSPFANAEFMKYLPFLAASSFSLRKLT